MYPGLRVFADYNGDGRRQNGEAMVEVQHDGTYRLPVDTRKLTMGDDRVSIQFEWPAVQREQPGLRDQVPAAGARVLAGGQGHGRGDPA